MIDERLNELKKKRKKLDKYKGEMATEVEIEKSINQAEIVGMIFVLKEIKKIYDKCNPAQEFELEIGTMLEVVEENGND